VLGVPQPPDPRDDVEGELVVRERQSSFGLGSERDPE
jgi:hypothetical protein